MITIHIDEKSIEGILNLAKQANPKDEGKAVFKGFKRAAMLVERALKDNISGAYLNVRSGHLRSSIGSKVEVWKDGLSATIGSGARQGDRVTYANIQETGGTIRPRIKQYLTIPLDAAMTPAGVTRFTAPEVRHGGHGYKSSFIRNHIIFGVKNSKKIVPLFVLKQSVEVPASHYLSKTRNETTKDAHREIILGIKEAFTKKEQSQ